MKLVHGCLTDSLSIREGIVKRPSLRLLVDVNPCGNSSHHETLRSAESQRLAIDRIHNSPIADLDWTVYGVKVVLMRVDAKAGKHCGHDVPRAVCFREYKCNPPI